MPRDQLQNRVEALLFALGPLTRAELAAAAQVAPDELEEALALLRTRRSGVCLVDDGAQLELRAAGEAAEAIERVRREQYGRELGRAGLEVLAALLYRGALTRAEIDFVRGVNSSQTLRTLSARGLIRKTGGETELSGRRGSPRYEPTAELLAALGLTHPTDLPDYAAVRQKLEQLDEAYKNETTLPS